MCKDKSKNTIKYPKSNVEIYSVYFGIPFRNLYFNLFHLGYNDKGCYHSSVKSNVAVQAALQNQMDFECLKSPILFIL